MLAAAAAQAGLQEGAWGLRYYPCRWPGKLPSQGRQVTAARAPSARPVAVLVSVGPGRLGRGRPFSSSEIQLPPSEKLAAACTENQPSFPTMPSHTRKIVTPTTLTTPTSCFSASHLSEVCRSVPRTPTLPSKTRWLGVRIRRGCVFFLDSPPGCLKTLHAAATRTLCKTTLGLLTEAIP